MVLVPLMPQRGGEAPQQAERMRRIAVLIPGDENDPRVKTSVSAFTQVLADLGWTDGRNLRIDLLWAGPDTNRIRALARELVSLQPDIIMTGTTRRPVPSSGRRGRSRSCRTVLGRTKAWDYPTFKFTY
jgi:hypothetical protein